MNANRDDTKGNLMSNLEISDNRAKQFDRLEESSINVIQEYFDGTRQGGDEVVTARCMLSVIKGNRQTQTARVALKLNMVQMLADEKQLKRYIEATQPEIKKALTGKHKK
jgi:hypothetical protein